MRWRLIDRITAFTPQGSITGVASVSLDAYLLHEPLGRDGAWPESLLIGACCELAHWFRAATTDWQESTDLTDISDFSIICPARAGELLTITLAWEGDGTRISIQGDRGCRVSGQMIFSFTTLAQRCDPQVVAEDWRVLRGQAA